MIFLADSDLESVAEGAEKKSKKGVSKVKQAFVIDFDEDIDASWHLKETKAATTVTRATLNKNSKMETTLPEDLRYDAKLLLQLFDLPAVMVTLSLLI